MKTLRFSLLAASTLRLLFGQGADWPVVGGDPGSTRYSQLTQITPANVGKLVRAWTYNTGDPGGGFRGTEETSIVVGGLMYIWTPGSKIVALNAATGTEVWKYDLKAVTPNGRGAKYGVSYWPGEGRTAP